MADIYDKKKRSDIMSKVSGKNTKPEIAVRKFLFLKGFRYRNNVKDLPGKPDIVLPKYKTVVFVNGCFWHGHNCKAGKLPKTNVDFWKSKINGNIKRDEKNYNELSKRGWKIIIIWQCDLGSQSKMHAVLESLPKNINSQFK